MIRVVKLCALMFVLMLGGAACGGAAEPLPLPTQVAQTTQPPEPTATQIVAQIVTDTPQPVPSIAATTTPLPTSTLLPPTETPAPTATPLPTETAVPTATPLPTQTPLPTETPMPTNTPEPTNTPPPTATPLPTATPAPVNVLLFDFETAERSDGWYIVNDGVMGGVSQSALSVKDGYLFWAGNVSLENNGGFASMRVGGRNDWQTGGADAVRLRVYGDGKLYRFQLYQAGVNYNYEAFFRTVADEWIEVTIPFTDFQALQRGFPIRNPRPIDSTLLNGAGLIIQDKQPGSFAIAVDWIRVVER